LVRLPKRISSVLDTLIKDLRSRESISGVGLFGSWSRGDAVLSSDVDLLIVDRRDFEYEYTERLELDDILIDLDYVPEKWIVKGVPPEIDQKLYEIQILYDRNWILANTREWMAKTYWRHERVDIRTENYLIEADTYLTRAASARYRGDLRSATLYTWVGLESILKILIEASMLPISNSHFIEALGESARRLGMLRVFDEYLAIAGLSGLTTEDVEGRLGALEDLWNGAMSFIRDHETNLKTLHVKVRNTLNYYGKPGFLKGMLLRSRALLDSEMPMEAAHYISRTSIDFLESYMWLKSAVEGTQFDYTTLIKALRGGKDVAPEVYDSGVKVLGLEEPPKEERLNDFVARAREITLNIRRRRKALIRENVTPAQ